MNSTPLGEYLDHCCVIARGAGAIIMHHFHHGYASGQKEDKSPVTEADIAANAYICKELQALAPHIPIIAEEDETLGEGGHALFWLVDPLDGTRSFVRGEPEFTVNIGLIKDGKPVLGVIYAPPQDLLYFGAAGQGAFRQTGAGKPEPIEARKPASDGLVVVRSKSHANASTAAYLESLHIKEIIPGSSSIKLCKVAEGSADLYPRFGRTMEWDTAAGHAILDAAGGRVETPTGEILRYGKPGFENPHFIAYGK